MFDKKFDDRLRAWIEFRNSLENSETPIQDTIDLYSQAPMVNIQVDPWSQDTWLDPWQLLLENKYCDFAKLLGIFYTLKLTTRFSDATAEIHICTDSEKSESMYLLFFGDKVIGYDMCKAVESTELPKKLRLETKYCLNLDQ
jgi:hypothetical protein